jgi:YVTN family beta-propeller protein
VRDRHPFTTTSLQGYNLFTGESRAVGKIGSHGSRVRSFVRLLDKTPIPAESGATGGSIVRRSWWSAAASRPHRLLRRRRRAAAALASVAVLGAGIAVAAVGPSLHAGPQGDGTAITPVGWHVTPVGQQLTLSERPYGIALSPDGKTLLVSNDGTARQSLMAVDLATNKVVQNINYPAPEALFLGATYAPDGSKAYASAGANDKIRTYAVSGGKLTEEASIPLNKTGPGGTKVDPCPAGLAISSDGGTLYSADNLVNAVSIFDLKTNHETRVPLSDRTCTIGDWGDISNGQDCLFPYGVALSRDGRTAYVSDWGQNTVSLVDTATRKATGKITVGNHPSAMALSPDGDELYVANTDSDTISVIDTATNAVARTISVRLRPGAPDGANPNSLAVSSDGGTLYVANAGDNDVAVIRLGHGQGGDEVAGLIPTGWYPTGVALDPSGQRIYAVSAKGLGAGPNPHGPIPSSTEPTDPDQYTGSMIKGTLATIKLPTANELAAYTHQVRRNDAEIGQPTERQGALPIRTGTSSSIKHIIYIVNENRTYDQVLGDLGRGDGDPSLTLFGWKIAPNHHRLAEQFTTLDNLYAAGEVSDDGWEWSTGGEANTLDQKTMPTLYGGRGYFYVGEGGTLAGAPGFDPKNSYIWNALDAAGISYRNYGFWATDVPPVKVYNEPQLAAHTDPNYAGFNMQISDQDRFAAWLDEFSGYEKSGDLPTVEFLKFPRDHTCGTSPSCPTPQAMVADSDLALGKLVDEVSHSKFWKSTAIFVIEDDAQNGPDHIDAHRTIGHVISPYTQLGKVDSTFYSSTSELRTMELILGLRPLTQFDQTAIPMGASFSSTPNLKPYDAEQPQISLDERNKATAPMAAASRKMNFRAADLANEDVLNEAIWQSVHGAHSRMPTPRHRLG